MQRKHSKNKRSILTVYVSLFLSMILFSSATFSWFVARDTATIQSNEFEMNASAGLRVNEGEEISNIISLENIKLSEVSSVDGRNMFLPVSGNYTADTYEMLFREASVGDQNEHFAYKNFTLTGDSELTQIYIKSYNIIVTDKNDNTYKYNGGTEITYEDNIPVSQVAKVECPVRIAFIVDSADTPIVIDPTALVDAHVTNYNAVNSVTSLGSPTTKETDYQSFSNHYFSYNDPIFELFGSESKNVTMVVWLEGTADTDVSDKFADATVSVDVELESNFSDTELIYFIDDTIGDSDGSTTHWINPDDSCIVTMAYYDENDNQTKTVVMNQVVGSKTKWYAPIPKNITTNIYFYRYSLTDEVIYNAWYTSPDVNSAISSTVDGWLDAYTDYGGALQTDRGTGTTYTALRGNGHGKVADSDPELQKKRLSPCIGFWDYTGSSGGSGGDSGGSSGGDSGDTPALITIGFAVTIPDSKSWITQNLKNGYSMYAVISSNGTETTYKMATDTNEYKRCEIKNLMLSNGSILTGFRLISSNDSKELPMVSQITLSTSYNYTFTVNNSDKIE